MLYISVFVSGICFSLAIGLGHASTRAACKIKFPYSSSHISAFYETLISRKGCTSNATTGSNQEVHVINLLNVGPVYRNDVAEVNLLIKSRKDEVLWEPVIFILYSRQPVRWRVRTEIFSPAKKRHIFVVPRYSNVKLIKSSRRRRQIRRINSIPSESSKLLKWAKKEYGAVTSLTELKRGNRILLSVGLDKKAPSECKIQEKKGANLNVLATYEQPQIFSGCDVPMSNEKISRVAYIVELEKVHMNPQSKTEVTVDLDIKSSSRKVVQMDFWLVLKSPPQVKWNIRTRKLKGYIDIVANSLVNISGIHMDTVGVRTEDISDTKQRLIQWVEYYIGPVAMYAGISLANKVKLVIPDPSPPKADKEKSNPPKTVIPAFERPNVTKSVLEAVLQSSCNKQGHLTVALKKSDVEGFGLQKKQFTLLDPQCKADENKTNIFLSTTTGSCGTTVWEEHGNKYFSNAILIHESQIPDLLAETGSGDRDGNEDMDDTVEGSGLGSHDVLRTTYMDDEDFHTPGKIRINFTCKVPDDDIQSNETGHSFSDTDDDVSCTMDVSKSPYFLGPDKHYPISLPVNSRIYAKVSLSAYNVLKVQVKECWLSPVKDGSVADKITLINKGCLNGSSVRWESGIWKDTTQSELFSFILTNAYPYSFLHCQMTACRKWEHPKFSHVTECPEDPQKCEKNGNAKIVSPIWNVVVGPVYPQESKSSSTTNDRAKTILDPGSVTVVTQAKPKNPDSNSIYGQTSSTVVVDGLDSGTVIGIAFAAFIIGILLMAALWFIHTHTGPIKHAVASRSVLDRSGESTPMSTAPLQINS